MNKKPKKLIAIGIILLILGLFGAIISFYVIIEDPGEIAKEKLYFTDYNPNSNGYDSYDYSNPSKTVNLKKGEYDIWYEAGFLWTGSPYEVTIEDSEGNTIYQKSTLLSDTGSISRGGKKYNRFGSFTLDHSDDYNITVDESSTLYLTPPINLALGNGLGYMFVIISIIGIIIFIIGLVQLIIKPKQELQIEATKKYTTKRPPKPPTQQPYPVYHYHYPISYPPPPYYTPYPELKAPCPECKANMRYIYQYQRWYCDKCKKYA